MLPTILDILQANGSRPNNPRSASPKHHENPRSIAGNNHKNDRSIAAQHPQTQHYSVSLVAFRMLLHASIPEVSPGLVHVSWWDNAEARFRDIL